MNGQLKLFIVHAIVRVFQNHSRNANYKIAKRKHILTFICSLTICPWIGKISLKKKYNVPNLLEKCTRRTKYGMIFVTSVTGTGRKLQKALSAVSKLPPLL
jgi:hypothetical protein